MKFSLVIPCYNESKNLPALIKSCEKLIKSYDIEVVIVDNGSNDDTREKFKTLVKGKSKIKLLRVDVNKGYGNGILEGLRFSKGDIIGWTHADMRIILLILLRVLKSLRNLEKIFLSRVEGTIGLSVIIFLLSE